MEIDIDELVDDIVKQADLDSYEADMLFHDINNLPDCSAHINVAGS